MQGVKTTKLLLSPITDPCASCAAWQWQCTRCCHCSLVYHFESLLQPAMAIGCMQVVMMELYACTGPYQVCEPHLSCAAAELCVYVWATWGLAVLMTHAWFAPCSSTFGVSWHSD